MTRTTRQAATSRRIRDLLRVRRVGRALAILAGARPPRWREQGATAGHLGLVVACLLVAGAAGAAESDAVGRVNVAGRSFCTGTLIGPQRAITAAHCLFDPATGRRAPLGDIHFVAGWDRGTFVAHAQPVAVRIAAGYLWDRRRHASSLERDLAILEFGEPVGAPRLRLASGENADDPLALWHYSHRRPHLVQRAQNCRRLDDVGRLWRLDCPILPGGSGAPLLVQKGDGARVTGIAIGRMQADGIWTTLALPIRNRAQIP